MTEWDSRRECADDNPKTRKCTYIVKIDGKDYERIYYLCEKCRNHPAFAEGIIKEESIRTDDRASSKKIVDITDSDVIHYHSGEFRSVSPTLVVDYKPPRNSQYRSSEVLS